MIREQGEQRATGAAQLQAGALELSHGAERVGAWLLGSSRYTWVPHALHRGWRQERQ
uniref:Uncharacterized protein n=1 Tax=Arundo donax TaxID=35708 RepID=A0A0A9BHL0_ARUDO